MIETLTCKHQDELMPLIQAMDSGISEYSFANLYLFRRQHDYRVLRRDGHFFLQGITYDGLRYLMPFSKIATIEPALLKSLAGEGFAFFPIAEEDLQYFDESAFTWSFNGDDSDYIYTREKIATYPGRHLHKKRNLIKQYRTLYQYEDKPYTTELADDAKKVLDEWFALTGETEEETDYMACLEAIAHSDCFTLSGRVYYAEGRPTGFLLGEELNERTFVIHFAKGVTTFKGIYAHMYNSLANALPEKYEILNFEQDLGKPTLRQAKATYLQDAMRDKYRVVLREGSRRP
jgi:hypothetical protein